MKRADASAVISHTNELNTDELLKANTLVLQTPTEDDEKKVQEIIKKNTEEIIKKARFGKNSRFYIFEIKKDKLYSGGIIEFDYSKVNPDKKKDVDKLENVFSLQA